MFYLLDTTLTNAPHGTELLGIIHDRLNVTGTIWITPDNASTLERHVSDEDAVVFCCPIEGTPSRIEFTHFLRTAIESKAFLLPIAPRPDSRIPPAPAHNIQSWDAAEFQAVRHHLRDYVAPAADEFVRMALARVDPTCFTQRPTFFIAHRRQDGESVARQLDTELRRRGHTTFRDLGDLGVGDDAQTLIEQHLADSDCMIFIDTPTVGESWYVTRELRTAIENRIPVVWVRIDPDAPDRAPLTVIPSGEPHVTFQPPASAADLADEVVRQFQHLASLMVSEARAILNDLHDLSSRANIRITRRPGSSATFDVEIARRTLAYPERPLTHVCQFFGRRVTAMDVAVLRAKINDTEPDLTRRTQDAVVLLDPRPRTMLVDDHTVIVNGQDYVISLGGGRTMSSGLPKLLLSGSWSEPAATDNEVLRAVGDLAEEWMKLGGAVVFGGHPTFTPVIVGAARRVHPITPERYVTMFQSDFFTTSDITEANSLHATVISTRDEGDRERSLRLMRTRMLEHPGIVAMVIIGGRADTSGIDDEIERADRQGINVVPLAAPGGRSAAIAAELEAHHGWSAFTMPPISGTALRKMSLRTDYRGVARDLFEVLAAES